MDELPRFWVGFFTTLGVFTVCALAHAQENAGVIRYTALVQHVAGQANRIVEGTKTEALVFKSVVYENDRLTTEPGTTLKILSRRECVAILYGEGQMIAPAGDRPWQIKTEAARWICPEGASDSFAFFDSLVVVQPNSEILVDAKRFLILKGNARVTGPPSRPTRTDSYGFNQEFRAPRESHPLEKPKVVAPPPPPPRPKTIRIVLSPFFGSTRLNYGQSELDQSKVDSNGARLQAHFKRTRGSLIAALAYREAENEEKSEYGQTPPNGVRARSRIFSLEAGYRFQHDRWWSPYLRAGLGSEKSKININLNETNSSNFSEIEYEFPMLTGAAGIDAVWSPAWANWLGLYGAIELEFGRSLGRASKNVKNEYCQSNNQPCTTKPTGEPTSLTTFDTEVMLGGLIQF